ncbi:regulatory protein, Fis family [Bacillus sp. 491mf]|uniref:helix-turn-helix domain-containing protein n=1 Tax=Bacillus sp. 491mf TaxID=1761755 RepID=UPI0008F0E501|nr:regulatory protein, Fis family [Bacillus sp. 491mf]
MKEDKFREDLLYRINVIHLHIPSLRERIDDIPVLCQHFIDKTKKKTNKAIFGVSPEVLQLFQLHQWPGNIHQLENVMERAFHFCQVKYIESVHLPPSFFETLTKKEEFALDQQEVGVKNRQDQMNKTDRNIILAALTKVNGNKTKAAELLGISRSTLYQKIKQYQITEARIFENSFKEKTIF